MEEKIQAFEPLYTEVHPAGEGSLPETAGPRQEAGKLPAGLVRLQEAGRDARNAFMMAGLLSLISLALFAVLFLTQTEGAAVVWPEEGQSIQGVKSTLVEAP